MDKTNTDRVTVSAGNESFTVILYDNEAAAAFTEMLPLTLDMSELNGNEKYFYMDRDLPVSAETVDIYKTGTSCFMVQIVWSCFMTAFQPTTAIQGSEGWIIQKTFRRYWETAM